MAKKKPRRMSKRQFDTLMREWFERYCDEVAALVAQAAADSATPPRAKQRTRKARRTP